MHVGLVFRIRFDSNSFSVFGGFVLVWVAVWFGVEALWSGPFRYIVGLERPVQHCKIILIKIYSSSWFKLWGRPLKTMIIVLIIASVSLYTSSCPSFCESCGIENGDRTPKKHPVQLQLSRRTTDETSKTKAKALVPGSQMLLSPLTQYHLIATKTKRRYLSTN